MRLGLLLLAFAAFIGYPLPAFAQPTATARVSQDVVEVGARFRYQADAAVRGGDEIRLVSTPKFGKLKPVGQQKVPQIITVNGVTERRLSLRYALVAGEEGVFEITPPTFSVGQQRVAANTVKITVVKAGAAPQPSAPKRDSRYFIDATIEPDHREPYVGQQLTLRYDLYVDGAQMDIQPSNSREPSLDDFWIHELTDRIGRSDQMVSVNGRLYRRSPMWSYALFPLQSGPIEIEPAAVDLVVGGFFRRGEATSIEAEAVRLNVRPLPPNAPDGFHEGNVGNWSFSVSTSESQTRVGRAFTVELTATGSGQVSRVRLPALAELDGARKSDVDRSTTTTIRGFTVGGTAKSTYTITPTVEGKITIPALEFHWFDPSSQKYRTAQSEPVVVSVAPGELGPAPIAPAEMAQRNIAADDDIVANLIAELHPLRDPASFESAPDPARFPSLYWLFFSASFAGFVWVSFGPRIRGFVRRAAPQREQRTHAEAALERIDGVGSDPAELARAIRVGLHEAWGIPLGAVTAADVQDALHKRGLDSDAGAELADVLAECEAARFAPDGGRLAADGSRRARRALEKLAAMILVLLAFIPAARAADWPSLVAEHPHAVDVHYNLGTQAAIDGDYGVARLALERASYLAPWDARVETNRSHVERIVRLTAIEQSRTGRTMEGDETLFWWRIATKINPHMLAWLTILFWLAAAAAVIVRRRSDSPATRDAAVVGLVLAVLLGAAMTFGAMARSSVLTEARPVVVLTDDLELREGPNVAAKLKRTPPTIVPGTLLRVVDERQEWVKVSWQGDAGWTRDGAVHRVDLP